jgi:hypothetical protein
MVAVNRFTEPGATHDVFAVSVGLYKRIGGGAAEALGAAIARVPAIRTNVAIASGVRRTGAGVLAMAWLLPCRLMDRSEAPALEAGLAEGLPTLQASDLGRQAIRRDLSN